MLIKLNHLTHFRLEHERISQEQTNVEGEEKKFGEPHSDWCFKGRIVLFCIVVAIRVESIFLWGESAHLKVPHEGG